MASCSLILVRLHKQHMKLLASLVGVFFILIGITGVSWPVGLMTIGYYLVTPVGLYVVAALRIGIGLGLVLAPPPSPPPNTLPLLRAILLVAVLLFPVL